MFASSLLLLFCFILTSSLFLRCARWSDRRLPCPCSKHAGKTDQAASSDPCFFVGIHFLYFSDGCSLFSAALFVASVFLPHLFREGSSGSYGPLPRWLRLLPLFCFFSTFSFFYCLEEETYSGNQNMGVASSLHVASTEMSLRLSACGYNMRF